MKKLFIIMMLLCVFVVTGCSSQGEESINAGVIVSNKTFMMADDATDMKEHMGEAMGYFEQASCAFKGLDRIYTYEDVIITTFEDGKTERIYSIELLTNDAKTSYATTVGDSVDVIKEKHEDALQNVEGTDIYEVKDITTKQIITYYTDGEKVDSIVVTYMTK